jgi:hypothetical protein
MWISTARSATFDEDVGSPDRRAVPGHRVEVASMRDRRPRHRTATTDLEVHRGR